MGLLEPITHKKEIEEILSEARTAQDEAVDRFNCAKENAENDLTRFGETKINIYSTSITDFLYYFKFFKNVRVSELNFSNNEVMNVDSSQIITCLEDNSKFSKELLKVGLTAAGTAAITGIAAYGGAKMIAGTAIGAKIAGLVAKSAAVKMAAVASFVFVPALIVFSVGAAIKGKERLAEAKKQLAKARNEAKKIDSYSLIYENISHIVQNYDDFAKKYNKKYSDIIKQLSYICSNNNKDFEGKIDFYSLTENEQKVLHLSWLMTQIIYGLLKQQLINEKGKAIKESEDALVEIKNNAENVEKQFVVSKIKKYYSPEAVSRHKEQRAKTWLAPCFAIFGTSLGLSIFYFYMSNYLCGSLLLINAVLAFPFSIFIKQLSLKAKTIIRILRFFICVILAFIIILRFH